MTTDQATAGPPRPGTGTRAAVPVPGDAGLVPGVSGRAHDGAASRALVERLGEALRDAVRVRVVVAERPDGPTGGPGAPGWVRPVPDLAAQGVDPALVAWRFTGNDDVVDPPRAGVAATVALLALGAAGWSGPVEVRDAAPVRGGRTGREGATVRVERVC